MSRYPSYRSLESTREIRLVTILPGNLGSTIKCSLSTTSLDSDQYYEALSYEWGDSECECTIELDGNTISIRENLFAFVLALRYRKEPRVFWVDAICINQRDASERNHQVGLMGEIYRKAGIVRAWLGPDIGQLPEIGLFVKQLANLEDISKERASLAAKDLKSKVMRSKFNPSKSRLDWWLKSNTLHSHGITNASQLLDALVCLMNRSYWTRVWIIQELVLAQAVVVHCGRKRLDGNSFARRLLLIFRHIRSIDPSSDIVEAIRIAPGTHILKHMVKRGQECSLLTLLYVSKLSHCTVTHDKIYALLGMASDISLSSIPIDYERSLEDLRLDVFKWFEVRTRAFDNFGSPGYRHTFLTELISVLSTTLELPALHYSGMATHSPKDWEHPPPQSTSGLDVSIQTDWRLSQKNDLGQVVEIPKNHRDDLITRRQQSRVKSNDRLEPQSPIYQRPFLNRPDSPRYPNNPFLSSKDYIRYSNNYRSEKQSFMNVRQPTFIGGLLRWIGFKRGFQS